MSVKDLKVLKCRYTRNAWQLFLQVIGVSLAVVLTVEDAVDVVKDTVSVDF